MRLNIKKAMMRVTIITIIVAGSDALRKIARGKQMPALKRLSRIVM